MDYNTAKELLEANFKTGKLFWKFRARNHFNSDNSFNRFNNNLAGKEAFTSKDTHGYFHGIILGKAYRAHRILWLLKHKQFPEFEIDHINQDRSDNRICNLREATPQQNSRNRSLRSDNKSGAVGVHFHKLTNKWTAQIHDGQRRKHLGLFETLESAIAARKAASAELGFHENHGAAQ